MLISAALHASPGIVEEDLALLLAERLAGLAATQREAELGTLAAALRSNEPPEVFGAAIPRVARALGEAGAHDFGEHLATGLARVARISRAPTNAPKVVDGAMWLAWAAGRLEVQTAREPLRGYLDVPFEVPFRTRVARSVAAWALTRLGDEEVRSRVARWNQDVDRTLPVAGGTVPSEAELLASPRWAERISSARVAAWVRRQFEREEPRDRGASKKSAPRSRSGS